MINEKNMLFTVSQFAKLHNINKRTLHYYDEIGLFTPAIKKENGYRYYTYLQSPRLEMLLTLRELDMSIEEIQHHFSNPSAESLRGLIHSKTLEIDGTIKQLKAIRGLLAEKEEQLQILNGKTLSVIDQVDCKAEYLLLSHPIDGAFEEYDVAGLIEQTKKLRKRRMFNYSYGTMISVEQARADDFSNECFFTKVEKQLPHETLFVKPAGRYLRGFALGEWEKMSQTYQRMFAFAQTEGLILSGYAYEEGINEMAISSIAEYITQITMKCD